MEFKVHYSLFQLEAPVSVVFSFFYSEYAVNEERQDGLV